LGQHMVILQRCLTEALGLGKTDFLKGVGK